MIKSKKGKLLSQIVMIAFLVMIVVGFSVPMMMNDNTNNQLVEPRICKFDSDCYLNCDGVPVTILCSQNLCQQNSCKEHTYYEYNDNPVKFNLIVELNGEEINLEEKNNSDDLFIKFSEDNTLSYSNALSLTHVLEKLGIYEFNGFELEIDGEKSYFGLDYVPESGDKIKIILK